MEDLRQKAAAALSQIEDAIIELLNRNPQGLSNIDVCNILDLKSSYNGQHKNYLSWSIVGRLLSQGRVTVTKDHNGKSKVYSIDT